MSLLIGALTIGFILSLLSLGVFISFRIFHFPDITTDGSSTLGAAVAAALIVQGVNPFVATFAGFVAGFIAGSVTGVLAAKFKINGLLAGILVMNVMLVAVVQRTAEIGLLMALGASAATIRLLFLAEAAMLSLAGAGLGWLLGEAGAALIRHLYPVFPAFAPDWAVAAGIATALATGLLFGVLPARRAARLDPVVALAKR